MPNVYKLDGSTNIKMGTFCGKPALFIRPMFPKDPVNHSHEERHAWHMNDLAEDEQVILMAEGQDLGQLYLAMRQPTYLERAIHRGEDLSRHIHTHPSTGEKAVDSKFSKLLTEWSHVSEPGVERSLYREGRGNELFSFENKQKHSTTTEKNDSSEPKLAVHPDPTLSFDNHGV